MLNLAKLEFDAVFISRLSEFNVARYDFQAYSNLNNCDRELN